MIKKILIIFICLFLSVGCSTDINSMSLEEIINTTIKEKSTLYNTNNKGYRYYLPRNQNVVSDLEYNESFKEAWFNAVCHNLWIDKIPPAIYGFEDRLEIISHGVLRDDLSIEDFYKGVSKPVNEALADIFLKLHYMEQSGKGTSVIINKYGKEVYHFGKSYIENCKNM